MLLRRDKTHWKDLVDRPNEVEGSTKSVLRAIEEVPKPNTTIRKCRLENLLAALISFARLASNGLAARSR